MLERTIAFLGVHTCAVAIAWTAFADEVPDNYLPGTWATGGAEACGTPAAEHITFDPDGTFRTVRGDQPTATGFWIWSRTCSTCTMVSSPAFFDDPAAKSDDVLSSLAGQYQYYYANALLFDITPDGFRTVASMGNMLRGANYSRCP
jgi:hypothetical protein